MNFPLHMNIKSTKNLIMFNSYWPSIDRKLLAKALYRKPTGFVQKNYFTPHDFGTQSLCKVSTELELTIKVLMNCRQISLPMLSRFKRINELQFPLNSPENQRVSDDFREGRSYLIHSYSFDVRSEINTERMWETNPSLKI